MQTSVQARKKRKLFLKRRSRKNGKVDFKNSHNYYTFGFNGQHKDNEIKGTGNSLDFTFRVYDSRLGRFLSVDPLRPKYPELTPYQFASNTPIQAIDIDGLEGLKMPSMIWEAMNVRQPYNNVEAEEWAVESVMMVVRPTVMISLMMIPVEEFAVLGGAYMLSKIPQVGALTMKLGLTEIRVAKVFEVGSQEAKAVSIEVRAESKAGEAVEVSKAEQRAAKLSKVNRAGKDFTKAGKEAVIDVNKAKNNGSVKCETCGTKTVPATQSKKGVTPSKKERQVDHKIPKSKGGSGTPNNGQVLCRDCNIKKSNN